MQYYLGLAHEQFRPDDLLEQAIAGERAGFDGLECSDHFQPWWDSGESGHAWIWLGAAAQATEQVPVGPAVTAALQRYHPALIAQGFATLEVMYPGRVFVGIGSGESLNESPVGAHWPDGDGQLAALEEALQLIRRLWAGEVVDHDGRFFRTKQARPWTRPETPPPLYVSAFHPGSAALAGRYGDGIWTLADPESTPELLDAYRGACDDADRDPGEIVLQAQFSWARSDEEALESCRVWKGAVPPEYYVDDWHDPRALYEHAEQKVSDEEFKQKAIISTDPNHHVERIREIEKLGATIVALMNISGADPLAAIGVYGEDVLPKLSG